MYYKIDSFIRKKTKCNTLNFGPINYDETVTVYKQS